MKPTTIIVVLTVLLISKFSFGQQTIILVNGESIEVNILSETSKVFEVRRSSNLEGNSLMVSKANIHVVQYSDGRKIQFNPMDQRELEKLKVFRERNGSQRERRYGLMQRDGFFLSSYYDNSERITKDEFKSILMKNPDNWKLYMKGHNQKILGIAVGIPSGFVLGDVLGGFIFGVENSLLGNSSGYNTSVMIGGLLGSIFSLYLQNNGNSKMNKAIMTHNEEDVSFEFEGTENGVGIILKF